MPRVTWGLCQLGMGLQALADAAVDDPGPLRERHDGTPIEEDVHAPGLVAIGDAGEAPAIDAGVNRGLAVQ